MCFTHCTTGLYNFEVGECWHEGRFCFNEDARLEIIAAYVGLPGVVIRINTDQPQCFPKKEDL